MLGSMNAVLATFNMQHQGGIDQTALVKTVARQIAEKTLARAWKDWQTYVQDSARLNRNHTHKRNIMGFKEWLGTSDHPFARSANWVFLTSELYGHYGAELVNATLHEMEAVLDDNYNDDVREWGPSRISEFVPHYTTIDLSFRPFAGRLWRRSDMPVAA